MNLYNWCGSSVPRGIGVKYRQRKRTLQTVRQLSRQSKGLKILVSPVRSRPTPLFNNETQALLGFFVFWRGFYFFSQNSLVFQRIIFIRNYNVHLQVIVNILGIQPQMFKGKIHKKYKPVYNFSVIGKFNNEKVRISFKKNLICLN